MSGDYRLEGNPQDEQKERLENWLTELKIISRQYLLLLETDDSDTRVVDLESQTVIALGLVHLLSLDEQQITGYDCEHSILDGVWPVDTPAGPVEQRLVGHVFPRPPHDKES